MEAKEYKEKYEILTELRGIPPADWYCKSNHLDNLSSPVLIEVMKRDYSSYERELNYTQQLELLNKERLREALPYKVGQKVLIRNDIKRRYKLIGLLPESHILEAEITIEALVSSVGRIYFHVKLENIGDVSRCDFHLYQDEIDIELNRIVI